MKQIKAIDIMFWAVLLFYLFLMTEVLFLRIGMNYNNVNLIPFKSIAEGITNYDGHQSVDVQVWGNVLIFIPAGIYLMALRKKSSVLFAFVMTFFISFSIEVVQFVLKIGISDIDDIILNCLGGIIGILIYFLLEKLFKTKEKTKKIVTIFSLIIGIPILIITLLTIFFN